MVARVRGRRVRKAIPTMIGAITTVLEGGREGEREREREMVMYVYTYMCVCECACCKGVMLQGCVHVQCIMCVYDKVKGV